ncbi:MAG: hypothetical protein ABR555_13285 [Pyrinomonadaceae bacterium]
MTFDYESALFMPVEDGEFVLISNSDESGETFVLPRTPRLEAPQQFYALYQDYYYCPEPDAGEIVILKPMVVVQRNDGWEMTSSGVLEVRDAKPARRTTPVVTAPTPADLPVREAPQPATRRTEEAVVHCTECDEPIEKRYAFCWHCGHPRPTPNESLMRPHTRLVVSTAEPDEQPAPVQFEKRSTASIFSSISPEVPQPGLRSNGSVLRLFSITGGALLVGAAVLFGLRYTGAGPTPTAATVTEINTRTFDVSSVKEGPTGAEMNPPSPRVAMSTTEDNELSRLREMRVGAKASDRSQVLQSFSKTEAKYAFDYRFPYERARMVTVDHKKNFHEQAFAALARAAEKAISSGKAGEMLENLNKDSSGDFQKLSHGHREWEQLQRALKSNDATELKVSEAF